MSTGRGQLRECPPVQGIHAGLGKVIHHRAVPMAGEYMREKMFSATDRSSSTSMLVSTP